MNKRVLIFGVAGQDGSYLAEKCLADGDQVWGVVRRNSSGRHERLTPAQCYSSFTLLSGDITDMASVLKIISSVQPDEIYNLAAQSQVGTSFDEPGHTLDVTGRGHLNILESARSAAPNAKIYFAGSSEQFGTSINDNGYQDEQTPFNPVSPYACAKTYAFNMNKIYRKAYGMKTYGGILHNHESPRRGPYFVTRKITQYVAKLYVHAGPVEKLQLGNIFSYRDFGYAPDFVDAMRLMLDKSEPDDYVVATGQSYSIMDFVDGCFKYINKNWVDYVEISSELYRPYEVPVLKGDAQKIKSHLGWRPTVDFHELITIMVKEDIGCIN